MFSEGLDCDPDSENVALALIVAETPRPSGTVTGEVETVTLAGLEPEVTMVVVLIV
jgi:hypothetical protein